MSDVPGVRGMEEPLQKTRSLGALRPGLQHWLLFRKLLPKYMWLIERTIQEIMVINFGHPRTRASLDSQEWNQGISYSWQRNSYPEFNPSHSCL